MNHQSWKLSLIEATSNTLIGFGISFVIWNIIRHSHVWDINTTLAEGVVIQLIFTVVSVARGFGLRRFYVWQHYKLEGVVRRYL